MSVVNVRGPTTSTPTTNDTSKNSNPSNINTGTIIAKRSNVNKMASAQSLNHLLNFTLPPRQTHAPQSIPRRSRKIGTQYGFWNKEKFVNAQYRFVMKPTGDYTVHFADPDIYFQWQDILQVLVPRTSALAAAAAGRYGGEAQSQAQALSISSTIDEGVTTCPICLSPPSAPRMTKCGHVFCFHCILHYLNTSDNQKWHRCPICFDSINERMLKCVKWFDADSSISVHTDILDEVDASNMEAPSSSSSNPGTTGSILHMRLMQRPQITTLALPRSLTWSSDLLPPHRAPFHFLPDVYRFAKFMLATPEYIIEDLQRDLEELAEERRMMNGMKDELGVGFVEAAEERVKELVREAVRMETEELSEVIGRAKAELSEIEFREKKKIEQEKLRKVERANKAKLVIAEEAQVDEDIPEAFLATQQHGLMSVSKGSNGNNTVAASTPAPMGRAPRQRRNVNPPPPSTSTYYFYQAVSGLPIFLHPLDIRILLSHFTSYSLFPTTISIPITGITSGSVDDDLRKRCKYLAHLPESTDVVFVEAELDGVVGEDGLRPFEGALKARKAKRREKERRDERARVRAEERESEKSGVRLEWAHLGWEGNTNANVNVNNVLENRNAEVVLPVEIEHGNERPPTPVEVIPIVEAPQQATRQPTSTNAWGARTFASALHSPAPAPASRIARSQSGRTQIQTQTRESQLQDEWDMDAAWHELEQRQRGGGAGGGNGGGGRKKKGSRMIILGGSGGRRR